MKLFMVSHTDDDGESYDLLVRCNTPEEAVDHWRAYYDYTGGHYDDDGPLPGFIYQINDTTVGPLAWHSRDGMLEVTTRYHAVAVAKQALGIEDMKP
jgi:hypothetical protein